MGTQRMKFRSASARFGGHCKRIQSANVSNQRRSFDNIIQHRFIRGYLWLPDLFNLIPLKSPLYTCRGMQVSSGSADQHLAAKLRSFRGMARIIQSDTQSARGATQQRIIPWPRGDVGPTLLHFGRSSVIHHGKKSSKLQDGARGPSKICGGGKYSLPW